MKEKIRGNRRLDDDEINWEITERIRKEPKFIAFNKWASDNGIISPNVSLCSKL